MSTKTTDEINILRKKGSVEQETRPFPDWRLIDKTLSRLPGSPICEGDYEIATLILIDQGWDKMWEYWDQRLSDIFNKIDEKLLKGRELK